MNASTPIVAADFRRICGHLPTGVTVLTSRAAAGPVGMAANSVTSVSLDPPMVLFCPARTSTTWPVMRETGAFCINIMASHHEAVTRAFAAQNTERFAGVRYVDGPTGPRLEEALAWIDCSIEAEHDAGDHTIVVARVVAIDSAPRSVAPLVFFRGAYGSFVAGEDSA